LRWGGAFLDPTQILSGIQFRRQFIEFVVAETNHSVGSNEKLAKSVDFRQ